MKKILIIGILLNVVFLNDQIDLQKDLILYYPFDGNSNDSSINNINGTLMNGARYTSDHLGNQNSAVVFDGIDDYVLSDSSVDLDNLDTPFTISAWVRIDSWTYDYWLPLISKSISDDVQFRIVFSKDNNYLLLPCEGIGTSLPPSGTWFYLTVINDIGNTKIYVNGILTDTFMCTNSIGKINYPLTIGNDSYGDTEYFNGAMDGFEDLQKSIVT